LNSNGYRVLRFWNNNDVVENIEGVLTQIGSALDEAKSPPPVADASHRRFSTERAAAKAADAPPHRKWGEENAASALDHPTPRADRARPSPSRGG
jgi:hypothetical protein